MDELKNYLLRLPSEQRDTLHALLTRLVEEQNHGVTVFTDGSCRNQGKKDAKAGFGVFWGDDHPNNHSGKVDGLQDNNRAELYAAYHAIRQAVRLGYQKIRILSDSEFVRLVIEKPQDFENKIAYIDYWDLTQSINLMRRSIEVSVEYVKAHSGHYGNVKADGLAKIGVRTVSLEMISRYTKKIRKFAAGRAKGKQKGKDQKKPNSSQVGVGEAKKLKIASTIPKTVQSRKKAATYSKPKNVEAKTKNPTPKTAPMTISSKRTASKSPTPKTHSAAPKKSAHLKTNRPSNMANLVRSISKISLTTTLTATQKRKQRRQRAKLLAHRDGCKDLRGAMKIQKEDVKKTSVQNVQNQKNQKKPKTIK